MVTDAIALDDACREQWGWDDALRTRDVGSHADHRDLGRHDSAGVSGSDDAPPGIIRKTYEGPPPAPPTFDAETQRRFDEWCDARIHARLAEFADIIGEESGAALKAEIAKLQTEIGQLRADIAILQSIIRGEVASIKQGKADVA